MALTYNELKRNIEHLIHQESFSNEAFTIAAKELFSFQYQHNQAYRTFCRKRHLHPKSIEHFKEIPPVPIQAFKEAALTCSTENEIERVFMTSGTTNPHKRGKNAHRDLDIYDLSSKKYFKETMMPDEHQMKMIVLFPSEKEWPNSSLAHYLQIIKEAFGNTQSEHVVWEGKFDHKRLLCLLQEAETKNEPVFVLGATTYFLSFLERCNASHLSFHLPKGSRIMDTGGMKSSPNRMDISDVKQQLSQLFGLSPEVCGNMYGMTELSSQIYDPLFDAKGKKGWKKTPPWLKTIVVDPETKIEKRKGEPGVIVHYDLANINSVMAIMTEDTGIKGENEHSFYFLGRVEGAEAKGCSLAIEEFLTAYQGDFHS